MERNIGLFTQYQRKGYRADYSISNVYQKTGFFPGAHGVPDASRVEDDGDSRNIELPYSKVNHLKVTTHQQYAWEKLILSGDLGFQNNHREEWSAFHTHYGSQPAPEKDPDKELAFDLNTYSASVKARFIGSSSWEHTLGWDRQHQQNDISGYSFCCRSTIVLVPDCSGLRRISLITFSLSVEACDMIMVILASLRTRMFIWRITFGGKDMMMNK